MANTPLMNTSDPAFQELLASLQPNILPNEPSVWPLAIGYWLAIALFIMLLLALFWFVKQHKRRKPLRAEVNRIKNIENKETQLEQIHALLRWLLINHQGAAKNLSAADFSKHIQQTLKNQNAPWVNAHYRQVDVSVDWRQVNTLINAWQKKGAI